MNDIQQWLYGYLAMKGALPGDDINAQLAADYFEAGLIDSFGVIELIMEIESRFQIHLNPENMQDSRFKTINGLAEIIAENQSRENRKK